MRIPQKNTSPGCLLRIVWLSTFFSLLFPLKNVAQEFPRGWIFPLELGHGMATSFNDLPDVYVGSIYFSPQYTVVKGRLRAGAMLGTSFVHKRFYGLAGPRLSLLITDKPKVLYSTVLNIQLVGEHLWGTKDQRLAGGGLAAEIGQLATLSVKAYRDYQLNEWWFQVMLGIHLFTKKASDNPFDEVR